MFEIDGTPQKKTKDEKGKVRETETHPKVLFPLTNDFLGQSCKQEERRCQKFRYHSD